MGRHSAAGKAIDCLGNATYRIGQDAKDEYKKFLKDKFWDTTLIQVLTNSLSAVCLLRNFHEYLLLGVT